MFAAQRNLDIILRLGSHAANNLHAGLAEILAQNPEIDLNQRLDSGHIRPPLYHAVMNGNIEGVKILVSRGASFLYLDKEELTRILERLKEVQSDEYCRTFGHNKDHFDKIHDLIPVTILPLQKMKPTADGAKKLPIDMETHGGRGLGGFK